MMKRSFISTALIGALTLSTIAPAAQACTRILWKTQDHGTFVTRTMDWSEQTHPHLMNFPAGSSYLTHSEKSNKVTSKYDVTGLTTYGFITDGVNSKGLSGNVLYDGEMDLAVKSSSKNGSLTYLRNMLSQYKSVNEVVAAINEEAPSIEFVEGVPIRIALHISFQDTTGDSAIVEWRNGKPQVWHGKQYTVMTNQPGYAQHLANVERSKRGWGEQEQQWSQTNLGTGGNTNPEDRFIHATYFSGHLNEPTSVINGILKLDSTSFKIPHDAPNKMINGKMAGYATEYSVNRHLDSGETVVRYQWGDAFNQVQYNVKEIQQSGKFVNFNISTPNLAGDITEKAIHSAK
ncbi:MULTISPECIES: linear amide C-N hydrolase [Aliivibrio]|uniref:linear amide C-N hydrolase n=1 Tax=Aliivibrio TaxID=511678 RepID=UPI00090818F5|nr:MULTISPECIES: linear amide C-N hydrolase [Aliivibrio]MBD1569310.1 linear amide C-N hydrolase [Aliivibrio sp. S10_S31]MUJ27476.1 linear amide C-N hydrolase [Aliivibrio fischeri]USR96938.1 linear amide C-N hydrolase [Aliivibrio fischeri ATCC 7744 = JCM 18803 = DSM 507]GGK47065.1 choloylglycine hydrolase [Aliivibrio fischeri]